MAVLGPWPHGDPMPLSSDERQRLAQIEAALRADRVFLAVVQDASPPPLPRSRRRRTLAATMLLIGIVLAVAGAAMATRSFVVGFIVILVGFGTAVAGAVLWFLRGDRAR